MKRATYVRVLIREEPFATGADMLAHALKRKGEEQLRVSRWPKSSRGQRTHRRLPRPDCLPGDLGRPAVERAVFN
jgi:hypothetical protein